MKMIEVLYPFLVNDTGKLSYCLQYSPFSGTKMLSPPHPTDMKENEGKSRYAKSRKDRKE